MSKVKLTATTGGGSTSLEAPNATTGNANVSWKLPVADGSSGQAITTNASGQLAFSSVGGGKVVGLSIANSTTNEQNTSGATTWTLVGPQITYTAVSSSNKLIFLHNHHMMVEAMTWRMALFRDGTSGTNLYTMRTHNQTAIWMAAQGICSAVADAPDTSSHTYQFAIYRDDGADNKIRYSPNSESTGSQVILVELEP